jgi:hypothetical protein
VSGGITLRTFDLTGDTQTGYLTQVIDSRMVDEFNGPGFGEVTVPLDSPDAALLTRDAVVKVNYEDTVRFAWFVEELDRTIVDSSGRQLLKASGRGILGWLDDAVVYPQRGLRAYNSALRGYNYVADDGAWTNSVTFGTPEAIMWRNDSTARQGNPKRWPDKEARWIWATDPTATVKTGTVNWFRSTFTLTNPAKVRFWATADNSFDLYLDGALLLSSADFSGQGATWTQFKARTISLAGGTHQLAARVENGKPYKAEDVSVNANDDTVSLTNHGLTNGVRLVVTRTSKTGQGLAADTTYYIVNREDDTFKLALTEGGTAVNIAEDFRIDFRLDEDNTAGFLMTAYKVNASNKPDGLVRRTDAGNWTVSTTEPVWYPALAVKDAIQEAQARDVTRLEGVTFDFTNTLDSAGTAWSTGVAFEINVGTTVLDLLDQMVDFGVDFWMRPTDGKLFAWENRGEDKTATVRFLPGSNLLSFSTVTDTRIKTVALVRSKDGWTQARRGDDTFGRRETFIEVGRTKSEATAKRIADRRLRRLGRNTIIAQTVQALPVTNVVPYVDFTVGDFVMIPSPTGEGVRTARILSLSLIQEGGDITYQPEMEVLDA